MSHNNQNGTHKSFLNTEQVILGGLLGILLTIWAGLAWIEHRHLTHSPVEETFLTAVYLTFLVGYVEFKYPTLFTKYARLAVFCLCFIAGVISLFFDSFAVILLFSTLVFAPFGHEHNERFNAFAVKAIASFNALTVGGAFYLGELWGLPHYISSNMDFPSSGLPLLLILIPYCVLTSLIATFYFPVKVESVPFDSSQVIKAIEFVVFLVLLIITHSPYLCLGLLLMYSALRGRTQHLIFSGLHEIREGAASALGLILAALLIQQLPGTQEWVAQNVHGPWVMVLSALSSPFAGAMIAPSENIHEF
ncbi:MAG TPA: hypothetical protein PLS49_03460, partial [Candidatus Woesebacteria bacterium]|nr:hypothetical protein [Candidatus Woesebacteria bacterium]